MKGQPIENLLRPEPEESRVGLDGLGLEMGGLKSKGVGESRVAAAEPRRLRGEPPGQHDPVLGVAQSTLERLELDHPGLGARVHLGQNFNRVAEAPNAPP
jgi:hypothetical protein